MSWPSYSNVLQSIFFLCLALLNTVFLVFVQRSVLKGYGLVYGTNQSEFWLIKYWKHLATF